ncbi:MAG: sodium:solute symporter [Chloroherpetonaceae bacterium]|nr:sodium:solute symporter [Chloroherpetonaceae bacterium]MDW8437849.1 sodium:solute symporter [Chloroherpetonaceae bacterium]
MRFTLIDWLIASLYVGGVTLFGVFKGGKQTSAKDYFLSEEKVSWWAVALAIVATETSALTFISVPGIAYKGNFNFLQLAIGYLIGRVVVAYFFLPKYFAGELTTVYALMESRFGLRLRRLTSVAFIVTRVFADGVRLYATAIPLVVIFRGYDLFGGVSDASLYAISIALISLATLVYVQLGGVRAVIWTDVVQLFIYLLGGIIAVSILFFSVSITELNAQGKFNLFNFSFDDFWSSPYQFFLAVIGGAFLTMASHGTDYIIVQRLFATKTLRHGQSALIASGFVVFFQLALFLFLGALLYGFYHDPSLKGDEAFSKFIVEALPTGVSGLIVAGLLAAAMSTLSGSISAISSSTVFDLYANAERGKRASEAEKLALSKRISLAWATLLAVSAMFYIGLGKAVVEVALSIASFTYGGLLGVFLLAMFFKRVSSLGASVGFVASVLTMIYVVLQTKLAWTLYAIVGSATAIAVASLVSQFERQPSLENEKGES